MKPCEILAVTRHVAKADCPENISVHTYGKHSVFAIAPQLKIARWASRRQKLNGVVERQKKMEYLFSLFDTLLPCLPGTHMSASEIGNFCIVNQELLDNQLDRFQNKLQYQLTISCDFSGLASRLGWAYREEARGNLLNQFSAQVFDALSDHIVEFAELPRDGEIVLNAAVLLQRESDQGFQDALETVDAWWPDGLVIRLVGPSPAISFGSLGLKRFNPSHVRVARTVLGVCANAGPEEIKMARRRVLMAAEPKLRPKLVEAAELCLAANRCGSDRFPLAFMWAEGQSSTQLQWSEVA